MESISEHKTRKRLIDVQLGHWGWKILPYEPGLNTSKLTNHAVEEYPTSSGPADYALFVEGRLLGIVEAKKYGVASQNVLEQAKRYARGIVHSVGRWGDYLVPFLYSSSGEQVYFLDGRNSQNVSRTIEDFHSPAALKELFERDGVASAKWLKENSLDYIERYYQREAIQEVEKSLLDSKRQLMLAMATGCGKTRLTVNQIYRFLRSGLAKRVLFLVDRRALAIQAAREFASLRTPAGYFFNQEFEVYSQRFKREDLEDDEKFDVNVMPEKYLTQPDASKTFVYVSTIQRMAINLLGKNEAFHSSEGDTEDDADKLDIPIHAFDVVIADECHRGYTSHETNVWRTVLNYFDAVKIGLTATPAAHTVSFFGEPVYRYPVEKAIADGFLVDYDAVKIKSNVRMNGVFLKEGEQVGKLDTVSGQLKIEGLEDERTFDASEVEEKITSPDSNKKIINELKKYTDEHERLYGRFPKTLIFAVNDKGNASHADQLVKLCKEIFNRGDNFAVKITGNPNVDRPIEKIRKFRNRPEPAIAVTVDMLSTGVDIPKLEYIVFLRPVKSRILWEQMLGRGTRLAPEINKEKFTVFDCFDGTLIEYFKDVSNFKLDDVQSDPVTIEEIIRRIDNNEERDYNVRVFTKRLRRIEHSMAAEAREQFKPFIPDGDVGRFANEFSDKIKRQFTETMKILKNPDFVELLKNYKRPKSVFYISYETKDEVSSETVFRVEDKLLKPKDYLELFSEFVRNNQKKIEAMKILLNKPKQWNTAALKSLRQELLKHHFPEKELRRAFKEVSQKQLVDIISMIRNAANNEPLMEVNERVDAAIQKVFGKMKLTTDQTQWLSYIREHLIENLTIEKEDFEYSPVLERHGGWGKFVRLFPDKTEKILSKLNEAIAA